MPKKGHTNNPKGRPKGSANRDVKEIREALQRLVDDHIEDFWKWIDQVATGKIDGKQVLTPDPKKASEMVQGLIEYNIPRISRIEQQALDKDGNPADLNITLSPADAYRVMVEGKK